MRKGKELNRSNKKCTQKKTGSFVSASWCTYRPVLGHSWCGRTLETLCKFYVQNNYWYWPISVAVISCASVQTERPVLGRSESSGGLHWTTTADEFNASTRNRRGARGPTHTHTRTHTHTHTHTHTGIKHTPWVNTTTPAHNFTKCSAVTEYLTTSLLQVYLSVCQRNNLEKSVNICRSYRQELSVLLRLCLHCVPLSLHLLCLLNHARNFTSSVKLQLLLPQFTCSTATCKPATAVCTCWINSQHYTVWVQTFYPLLPPTKVVWQYIPKEWECLTKILYTSVTLISTHNSKILSDCVPLSQRYAVLTVIIQWISHYTRTTSTTA